MFSDYTRKGRQRLLEALCTLEVQLMIKVCSCSLEIVSPKLVSFIRNSNK